MRIEFCPEVPCLGLQCPRLNKWAGHQSMGMRIPAQPHDPLDRDRARLNLGPQLAISYATDRDGVKRTVSGAEFEIHVVEESGDLSYCAMYSGDREPQEMLAEAPQWTEGLVAELLKAANGLVA